jgi:predicted AAA+ superfamily ATPase
VPESGPRFENLAACHLLKWCFLLQDTEGRDVELRYFRDVDRREVDFVVTEDARPVLFIECKQKDKSVSRALRYLKVRFPEVPALQLYQGEGLDRIDRDGIRICPAHRFFAELV